MNIKLDIVALAAILLIVLFLWIHSASAGTQNQAHADIKNAEGTSVGTASLRETKDGVLMTVTVKGFPKGSMLFTSMRLGSVKSPPLRAPEDISIRRTKSTVSKIPMVLTPAIYPTCTSTKMVSDAMRCSWRI
jgi:hypothetical protein